ncbi:MAG: uroporphyrinogen-III C-methyltransferase [Gammaproteobacteria bacterium]
MNNLHGLHVLVTRPEPSCTVLCEKIRARGGKATAFATIEIAPPQDATSLPEKLAHLDQYDWLIFISPQAVYQCANYIKTLPEIVKIAAVGESTAHALQATDWPVHVYPEDNWNSEALLALPEFAKITGKKIAIIKGEGGRKLLADELQVRGAIVTPIPVYQRKLTQAPIDQVVDLLRSHSLDVIICTSIEGLDNLKKRLETVWPLLREVSILVISQRMQDHAAELGFKKTSVAKNASDECILTILAEENRMVETTTEQNNKPTRTLWSNISILFSTLAIIILLIIFFGTTFYYLRVLKSVNTAQVNTTQLEKTVDGLQQQVSQLSEELKSQSQVVNALRQTQSGNSRDEWHVLEAEFLTKMANDKLQLENNIPQAILLLQSADQEIRNLNDAKYLPIRKALASDIANLQATPQVDIAGIYMRLAAANEQISKLPLPNKPAQSPVVQTSASESLPWWKRGLQQTWQALRQIVIVRYNPNGTPPLALPEQQDFLYLNLHVVLEKAMWGLLHQQPEVYRASLDQAIKWIKLYFVQDAPLTQSLLTNLTELQALDIHPALPKMTDSLKAFQDYFAAHGAQVETQSQPAVTNP